MTALENVHAKRLYCALERHAGADAAEQVLSAFPLSKTPSPKQKATWANAVCARLAETLDPDTQKAIRMDCACGPSQGKMDEMKSIYEAANRDLSAFAERGNAAGIGATFEVHGDALYLCYPRCYCSFIKNTDAAISPLWCACTLGYTKRMFEYVLGTCVDVELIESVKTGGARCVIKITGGNERG